MGNIKRCKNTGSSSIRWCWSIKKRFESNTIV